MINQARFILAFLMLIITFSSKGEGSKTMYKNSVTKVENNEFVRLGLYRSRSGKFATPGASNNRRLNVRVDDPDNQFIHLGARRTPDTYLGNGSEKVYFRVVDPNDNTIFLDSIFSGSTGYIDSLEQVRIGPSSIPTNINGYVDHKIPLTGSIAGDFYIEFHTITDFDSVINGGNFDLDLYDITLSDGTNAKSGRVWAYEWNFHSGNGITGNDPGPNFGSLYFYSSGGVVTSIDFNGAKGTGYELASNGIGLGNSLTKIELNRQSDTLVGASIDYKATYQSFFEAPDENEFPSGNIGQIVANPTFFRCDTNSFINFEVSEIGQYDIILDLDGNNGYQENTKDIKYSGLAGKGENTISIISKDNLGNPLPLFDSISIIFEYRFGITHLVSHFLHTNDSGFTINSKRPSTNEPTVFWDDTKLGIKGTPNTYYPSNYTNLLGCKGSDKCRKWSTDYGKNTLNTWWYVNVKRDTSKQYYTDGLHADFGGKDTVNACLDEVFTVNTNFPSAEKSNYIGSWLTKPDKGFSSSNLE